MAASKPAAITLLHLSDLQFGAKHRFGRLGLPPPDDQFDSLLKRLTDDLDQLRADEGLAPQLIVVSGDLAETGKKSEYEDVRSFLVGLTAHLDLPRSHVVLVPGNHDINRKACQSYFDDCEADERQPLPPYWPKWRHFVNLFQAFYGDLISREPEPIRFTLEEPWTLYELPELQLVVAGFNSTLAESHRDGTHYGDVGESQLRWFQSQLQRFQQQGWFRLGVLHHNYFRAAQQDDENLRDADDLKRLVGPHLNLVLHGHTHDSKIGWLDPHRPVVSTGSAALLPDRRPEEVPNQYQIVRLSRDGIERWTRSFVPTQRRWTGDTSCSEDGRDWPWSTRWSFRTSTPRFPRSGRRRLAAARRPRISCTGCPTKPMSCVPTASIPPHGATRSSTAWPNCAG